MNLKKNLNQLLWNLKNTYETSNNLIKKIDFIDRIIFNDYLNESEKSNYTVDGLLFLNNQCELLVDRNRFINNLIFKINHYINEPKNNIPNEINKQMNIINEKIKLMNKHISDRLGFINLDVYESNKIDDEFKTKIENIFCKWYHYQASRDNLFAKNSFEMDKLVDILNALNSNIRKQIQAVKVYCKVIIKNIEQIFITLEYELTSLNELDFESISEIFNRTIGFKFGDTLVADSDYINLYKSINNINNHINEKNVDDRFTNINPEIREQINNLIFKHFFFNRLDGVIRVDDGLDGLNWLLKNNSDENYLNNTCDDFESIAYEIDNENEYIENLTNGDDDDETNEW